MTTHLWDMQTSWFEKPKNEHITSSFQYKSWKDFQEYKPYKLWKPYILSSWCWKTMKLDDEGSIQKKKWVDKNNHILDCTKMLRIHPSSYDTNKLEVTSGKEVEMLQIVFISPDRFAGLHRVEMFISRDDEEKVREWLKSHTPTFWKL